MRASNTRIGLASFSAVLFAGLTVMTAAASQRGEVTSATLSAASAQVGSPVTLSVSGRNPCGAVHVDWGDGTAITYPIVQLNTTHQHAYEKPGTYTIVARGMGNCDGSTSPLKVRIDPAPAPPTKPDQPPRLLGLKITPNPATTRNPVSITVDGRGRCQVTVDFGDGTDQRIEAALPARISHSYARSGVYEVFAWTEAPCGGEAAGSLTVRRR